MPPTMNMRGPRGPRNHGKVKMPEGGMKTIGRLVKYVLKNYRFSLAAVMVCIVVTSFTTLASTLFTRSLIDDYILPLTKQAQPDFSPLAQALTTLGAVLIVGAICSYLHSRLMINVSQGTMKRLRNDLFSHMEKLPIKYFDSNAHGDIMSIYTNDVDTLRQMISQSLPNVFSSLITITITFGSMLMLSWPLALLVLVLTLTMVYTTKSLSARSANHFVAQQQSLGQMNGFIEEMLTGQKVVKTFCHEDEAIEQFQKLNESLRSNTNEANRVANIIMPINGNLSNLIYVLCAVFGALIALNQISLSTLHLTITIGTLVSFLTLIRNFTQPVSQVSNQINSVVMAVAGASRVFRLMDEKPEDDENADVTLVNAIENADGTLTETEQTTGIWAWKHTENGKTILTRQRGEVDFSHVDFSYPQNELTSKQVNELTSKQVNKLTSKQVNKLTSKQVLFDINLDTDAGQKIAIVGGTGAGKTTLMNLITRFYDIEHGSILYDGIPINRICRKDLRRSLGMVLQETHLFTGTVMENIRYGRITATDEECIEAAKKTGAHDFICRLADGYQTMLRGDGGNLSQGERQLLAIARTAVANPPALILDEATSSIDTHTEQLVQKGMDSLMQGRSTFVIAHRLSTIRNSDSIVVMQHGRIAERGTHEALLELGGIYHQLHGNSVES
ncbi:MAG: ABC transporter ATP-binding protein [Prevotella sp.]|nr:ABC transporter ATP-binding protein [Prevotella sp.]